MSARGIVYIVHCVDTEGPLHESLEATFERLKQIFGLEIEPSAEALRRLQAGEWDLGGLEAAVQKVVDPHLLAYNDDWAKVDSMLAECLSGDFRGRYPDSFGGGWVYNWFCVDHVDYDINPRRRDMGYHNVFDHYRSLLRETRSEQDGLHFHYHPHSFKREAHKCATHWWASSQSLYQVISRRVIDRMWFPSANRPGFHAERPDSHWFLEQFIPFDFSNQAVLSAEDAKQSDAEGGRFGDWRRAPVSWAPYHPAADDYQVPGASRRWIARCLNIGTRYRLLSERDVRQAFEEAAEGRAVVLSVTNHDFRDMRPDIDLVRGLLAAVAPDFPQVDFKYSEAAEAMRSALGLREEPPCELDLDLEEDGSGKSILRVRCSSAAFGPQPWLALKSTSGDYYHDNLDINQPFHDWQYVFDAETLPLEAVEVVGVATNNSCGITTVATVVPRTGRREKRHWNVSSEWLASTKGRSEEPIT